MVEDVECLGPELERSTLRKLEMLEERRLLAAPVLRPGVTQRASYPLPPLSGEERP